MKMYCFAKNYMFKKTSELYEFLQKNQFVCAIIASLFIISILTLMWGVKKSTLTFVISCYLLTGQAQDGDLSRIARFKDLLAEKGLTGRFNLENTGYYSYVTDLYNYSHIIEGARHLLNNASDKEWPNLKWLLISCDSGYIERLR